MVYVAFPSICIITPWKYLKFFIDFSKAFDKVSHDSFFIDFSTAFDKVSHDSFFIDFSRAFDKVSHDSQSQKYFGKWY